MLQHLLAFTTICSHMQLVCLIVQDNTHSAWTSAYFLPHWADPGQLKSTEVSYDYHEDDELSSLECYKLELSKQLGMSKRY